MPAGSTCSPEWGDDGAVHCALYEPETRSVRVASIAVEAGRVPSLAQFPPPALRLERALADLFGYELTGLPDRRPWLDHGTWTVRGPLAARPERREAPPPGYQFLDAEGPGLHQIPVGPVHAGIIEPGHFRFTVCGETIVRLEGAAWLRAPGNRAAAARVRDRGGGPADRACLGRQHRGLFVGPTPGGRDRARLRSAAARPMAACCHGRTRAYRESPGRYRCRSATTLPSR